MWIATDNVETLGVSALCDRTCEHLAEGEKAPTHIPRIPAENNGKPSSLVESPREHRAFFDRTFSSFLGQHIVSNHNSSDIRYACDQSTTTLFHLPFSFPVNFPARRRRADCKSSHFSTSALICSTQRRACRTSFAASRYSFRRSAAKRLARQSHYPMQL